MKAFVTTTLFTVATLIIAFLFSMSILVKHTEVGDMSRRSEDGDIIHTYAETKSLDILERALDTGAKKQHVLWINVDQDPYILQKMEDELRQSILDNFNNTTKYHNIEVEVNNILISPGKYDCDTNGCTQSIPSEANPSAPDERPYIAGDLTMTIIPLTNTDNNFTTAEREKNNREVLKQKITWFVYANPIPKDYVKEIDRN